MPLKLRPTGLGSGIDKDRPEVAPALASRSAWFSPYRSIAADQGGNRPLPPALVSRVQAVPLCLCTWVCVKPRLAPAAVRGFRLELVSEQNPIHFSYRPLGPRRSYDHGSRCWVRRPVGCDGSLRGGLSALARRNHNAMPGARVIEDSRKERLA